MLDPVPLVLAACAVTAGALVQGSVGFGFALVAAPLLALINPALVPGSAVVASAGLGLMSWYRTRGGPTDWLGIGWAGLGVVPGTLAAGAMLAAMSGDQVAVAVGAMILLAVLVSLTGLDFRRTPSAMLAAGMVSGFMGTAAAVGGPPVALAYQRESGPVIRSTLCRFFLLASVPAIAVLVPAGRLGWDELAAGLALLPGVVIGFLLSRRLHRFLDRGWARPAVLTVAAVSATAVLARELL